MKFYDRNLRAKVGAQLIGASPIDRPGVGCGIARRICRGTWPINRRWAR
ncbi:MAG TPA: hypothetical protein VED37_02690 [Ktedonobacteraceae bacterium]|nr:hypothetical protein [Ktedonobacteraceae bacterium]